MIFDILIVIVFIYIGMIGFRRGVWFSALHLGATLFSLWVAQRFYFANISTIGIIYTFS